MNNLPRISVMIVDDHDMVRRGACSYLEAQPDIVVVAQAGSGEEAVQMAKEFIPDVVLMDLVMEGMDGVEATRRVKDASPRTQIVVLTSFHQDEFIFPALQAGAISYLLKGVKASELLDAIRRAARGEAKLHPRIASRKLIAKGNSNEQISAILVISVGTVKGHVSNILSKLHLVDRTQAAAYARQKGIVRRE